MTRHCGSCTMCCKMMGVPEFKERHTWCKYCVKGVGCGIYEQRPDACRSFECGWLVVTDFPDELRPDRCGVVIQPMFYQGIIVHCDPAKPLAWRNPLILQFMRWMAAQGFPVSIEAGRRHWVVGSKDIWEADSDNIEILPNGAELVKVPKWVVEQCGIWVNEKVTALLYGGNSTDI